MTWNWTWNILYLDRWFHFEKHPGSVYSAMCSKVPLQQGVEYSRQSNDPQVTLIIIIYHLSTVNISKMRDQTIFFSIYEIVMKFGQNAPCILKFSDIIIFAIFYTEVSSIICFRNFESVFSLYFLSQNLRHWKNSIICFIYNIIYITTLHLICFGH